MTQKLLFIFVTTILATGCSGMPGAAPTPLPTVMLGAQTSAAPIQQTATGGITASGVVVSALQTRLAAPLAQRVKAVHVAIGDPVQAGQVLIELDDADVQTRLAQAHAGLAVAQANLAVLKEPASESQIAQANAALMSARAAYSRTLSGPSAAELTAAQAALDAALAAQHTLQAGPRSEDVAAAQAALLSAEAALKQAQSRYDDAYRRDPAGISGNPAALALEQATQAMAIARAAYDKALAPPDAAQLAAARQQVAAARATLAALQAPPQDADLAQAQAQIDIARARLDELKTGPSQGRLAVAQAQVAAAQTQVEGVQAQLTQLILRAPAAGTVSQLTVHAGEWVSPGQPLLVLTDMTQLQAETTDLGERDVPNVRPGQAVSVLIKALNTTVPGTVSAIAPEAERLGGDVVYKVTVVLQESPAGLRPGMTVDVTFGA